MDTFPDTPGAKTLAPVLKKLMVDNKAKEGVSDGNSIRTQAGGIQSRESSTAGAKRSTTLLEPTAVTSESEASPTFSASGVGEMNIDKNIGSQKAAKKRVPARVLFKGEFQKTSLL